MIQTEIVASVNHHWLNERLSKLQEKGHTIKDIKPMENGNFLIIYEARKEPL